MLDFKKNGSDFMSTYSLKRSVKQKTFFENPESPSCINIILINSPRSFQNNNVFEMGHSGFHKLPTPILKQYFPKPKSKTIGTLEICAIMNLE